MPPMEIIPAPPALPTAEEEPFRRLLLAFLSNRSPATLLAYRRDLGDFRQHLGAPSDAEAARRLLGAGAAQANLLVLEYRGRLHGHGLRGATINRRLSALRTLIKLARTFGLVDWKVEVENARVEPWRDTRGPGREGFVRALGLLEGKADPRSLRDRAMLRLLFDLALRRAEVVRLDRGDLDLARGTLAVLGKGRDARQLMTLPRNTQGALTDWVAARGEEPGPLFPNFDRAGKGASRRLSGTSLYRTVVALGQRAGVQVRPHGLRHAAITEALDRSGGNVRAVQRFSRHRDLRVLTVYDDNRADLAGDMARLVADAV